MSTVEIGQTFRGRKIIAINLSSSDGQRNPGIVIEAGIYGREWIGPATALYLVNQIAYDEKDRKDLLNGLDWYIVPVLNPDGYEYTFETAGSRLWHKNRAQITEHCIGTDLNRNFAFAWNQSESSQNPCDDNFIGSAPFSEAESIAMREYVKSIKGNQENKIKAYLSLRGHGQKIAYPWSHTNSPIWDANELKDFGESVNKALGGDFQVGSYENIIGTVSGGSGDWARGVEQISKAFTLVLPGDRNGLDVPPGQIEEKARIALQGIRVFARNIQNN